MSRARGIPETVIVAVAFRLVKRGGRKTIVLPEGMPVERASVDGTMVKALARAFRWKRILESGDFATTAELAERENIPPSYLTRILRLTLLAPDVVESIMAGRQGDEVTLAALMEPLQDRWVERKDLRTSSRQSSLKSPIAP